MIHEKVSAYMDNRIQEETYKLLYKALENNDIKFFLEGLKRCIPTQRQLLSFKALAQKTLCNTSILLTTQNKMDQDSVLDAPSIRSDTSRNKQQKPPLRKKHHAGEQRKKDIIAYNNEVLRYCIFDKTAFSSKTRVVISTNVTIPGYVCPKCHSIYVHYQDLPPKGSKHAKKILVRDILRLSASIRKSKKQEKILQSKSTYSLNQHKSSQNPPSTKKTHIYVSIELPQVCSCNSIAFESTKYFSLGNSNVHFHGKYCKECKKWFITEETFTNLPATVRCKIDRKAVTWIKPSGVPLASKAIPSKPTSRPLFWWEKKMHMQDGELMHEYSPLQGQGKQVLQVSFGIDFGASTTKVIIRNKLGVNKPSWRALVFGAHFACEENSNNTLAKSEVYISDTGRISLGKKGVLGWKARPYFKAVLVDIENYTKDLDEVYYAIFFIATILKTFEEHLKRAYPPAMYSAIDLHITMGMPIRGEVGRLSQVFTNILHIADELKENKGILLSEGMDFEKWKSLCRECHAQKKSPNPYLFVRPELYAEVTGLFNSSYGPRDRALVIDVGSATLDIALVYTQPPLMPYLYIPIAEVAPLGIEVAASRLISSNPTIFSDLQSAREYLIRLSKKNVDDKVLRRVVLDLLQSCIPKIQRVETTIFGETQVEPIISIYFYGGGRDSKWFKKIISHVTNSGQKGINFIAPKMQLEIIPRVPHDLLHRFQVSYGLSNKGEEKKPLKALPNDFKHLWSEQPFKEQKRYVDLEELQKNLYGG